MHRGKLLVAPAALRLPVAVQRLGATGFAAG